MYLYYLNNDQNLILNFIIIYVCKLLLILFNFIIKQDKNTALTLAADRGHTEICKFLVENGANVNHEGQVSQNKNISICIYDNNDY